MKDKIKKLAIELLGPSFTFREGQLDAIVQIVANVKDNVKHTMLEAPTGSGKSMIALLSAYALWMLCGKKTYILVSDLSLYKQYENDIYKLNSTYFGCIKGKENYICSENGCKASHSVCSLAGASISTMLSEPDKWRCRHTCQYMKDYIRAAHAPITLMTYQLYFTYMNVEPSGIFKKSSSFLVRDLVICDECHKLCEICQSFFAPTISFNRPHWMDVLDKYASIDPCEQDRSFIARSIASCSTNEELVDLASMYEKYLFEYVEANERIRLKLAKNVYLSKNDKAALFAGANARQEYSKLFDMLRFIEQLKSSEYLVKTVSKDDITLNFIFDDVMLKKYFHNKARCELLMSATIGDFNSFANLSGMEKKNCRAIALPSTFDFRKSPIIVSSKNWMTYENKKNAIVEIAKQVVDICKENNSTRGIIQTGSYENARALLEAMPEEVSRRCLWYNNTSEKSSMLDEFMERRRYDGDNSILVGPTLIEGLNFPDDACRFQICVKVPYACLGSEYVKKKMQYVAGWYEYDVLNKLCQGIGRGIRHKNDWCKTYILDGNIMRLINRLKKFNVLNGRFEEMKDKQ